MSCFDNLIGIDNICSPVVPTSGMYINNLAGITINSLNSATNSETSDAVALINEKITFSTEQIKNHLRSGFQTQLSTNSILATGVKGFYKEDNSTKTILSNTLYGIKCRLNMHTYSELFIQGITLRFVNNETGNIFIYDLNTGLLLNTIPFTALAGEYLITNANITIPNKKQYLNLFICYQTDSNNAAYDTNTYKEGSCTSCYGNTDSNFIWSGGNLLNSLTKIEGNLNKVDSTYGLSFNYSLNCSIEPLMCTMSSLLAYPLLYKVGAEIMLELIYSDRLNSVILLGNKDHRELYEMYNNEYMSAMKGLLDSFKMPNDICFNCKPNIKKTVQIP